MWGSKKNKAREPLGYQNDMSAHQEEVFKQFKDWIETNNITENPWHTDSFLLRFCRARKFELDKIKIMFSNYMQYRKENDLDHIIDNFVFKEKDAIAPYYPKGYCGIDKLGRPIYIEKAGQLKPDKIWENVDEENLWKAFFQSYEVLQKLHFMACSIVKQQQIQHTLTIIDMNGFSLSMFNKKVTGLVKQASKITQDYYPEQLGQMYIINAPMLFTGCWAIVKGFLDEKTREKISIVGSGFITKVLEVVDKQELIAFLGGSKDATLEDDSGPWNDFVIVDGCKKGDIVGVRRKSDGPDGPIFTPHDLEKLPNYMIADAQQ